MSHVSSRLQKLFHVGQSVNTHFEIGKHLHSDVYYYAKRFFQRSDNAAEVAVTTSKLIYDLFGTLDNLTLIGCGTYMGLFLKEIVLNLQETGYKHPGGIAVNYAIVDNSEQDLSFFFQPEVFYKNLIIILPITCTFVTYVSVRNFLHAEQNQDRLAHCEVSGKCISVFLIVDEGLKIPSTGSKAMEDISDVDLKELYISFGWKFISATHALFGEHKNSLTYQGYYHYEKPSVFYLPEKCKQCFPGDLSASKSLFPTRVNHDIPDLIFGLPSFANFSGEIYSDSFSDINFTDAHLFGHLKMEGNSYLHYIKRSKFYENNKGAILHWLEKHIQKILVPWAADDRLVIITPRSHHSSAVLQDLANTPELRDKKITMIELNPSLEFLENFIAEFKNQEHTRKIIFFDFIISSGKTFEKIDNYLRHATGNTRTFDLICCIFDRTTEYSKQEILHKLDVSGRVSADSFITFFKLNVPQADAKNSGNPITFKNEQLLQLMNSCHLDALKLHIADNLLYGAPRNLEQLSQEYRKIPELKQKRYLLELYIAHEISRWFFMIREGHAKNDFEKQSVFTLSRLKQMIATLISLPVPDFAVEHAAKMLPEEWSSLLTDLIISILSKPPFKFYQGINQAAFEYTNEKLLKLLEGFESHHGAFNIAIFKFYIKRSVELNSNFIISQPFIAAVKQIFDKHHRGDAMDVRTSGLLSIKYFLLKCYKELVFKNPTKAVRLEQLMNTQVLLPQPFLDPSYDFKKTLEDEFYQMGRIIKAENIFLLNTLRSRFILDIKHRRLKYEQINEFIKDTYFSRSSRSDATIRLAQQFLEKSKDKSKKFPDTIVPQDIYRSLEKMFRAIFLMKSHRKKDYISEIKEILAMVCSVLGENLDFSFFIEYRDRIGEDNQEDIRNIFTISSDKSDDPLLQPVLHREGLVYNMLYGLKDDFGREGNMQTFIPVVRDNDNNVLSFNHSYIRCTDFSANQKEEIFPIDSIKNDYGSDHGGLKMIEESKLILLFRLARVEINYDNHSLSQRGEAVLAICNRNIRQPTPKDLIEFIDVEKVRLLLLIKNDLLEYLQKYFDNDAFIELVGQIREQDFRRSMEHGLRGYFTAMRYLTEKTVLTDKEREMLRWVQKTIHFHIRSAGGQYLNVEMRTTPVTKSGKDLSDFFDVVMETPGLSHNIITGEERIFDYTDAIFSCHPVIYNQVIPELIVNMRKYALQFEGPKKKFSIHFRGNIMVFSNPYSRQDNPNPKRIKKGGGKEMCNKILAKLNLPVLDGHISRTDPTIFETRLVFMA